MPFVDPTYLFIALGLAAVVLGVLWPANSRRWGTERTMPADPEWEPWAYVPVLEEGQPSNDALQVSMDHCPLASYRVGEIIETSAPRRIGDGR